MEEKIYFLPGNLVTLRQELPNKPVMLVVKKVVKRYSPTTSNSIDYFQGILCRWFSTDGTLQEAVWNTKDLIKL